MSSLKILSKIYENLNNLPYRVDFSNFEYLQTSNINNEEMTYRGKRGGLYYIRNNKKIYLSDKQKLEYENSLNDKFNFLPKLDKNVLHLILLMLSLDDLLNFMLTCRQYYDLVTGLYWNKRCFQDFGIKVISKVAKKAYKGKLTKIDTKLIDRTERLYYELYDFIMHYKYRNVMKSFFHSELSRYNMYKISALKLFSNLQKYYREEDPYYNNADKVNGVISQYLMDFKGDPYECPDGIYPCFSCGLQSPTLELMHFLITIPGKKDTMKDFFRDCKLIPFVYKDTFKSARLFDFVQSYR